MNIPQLIDEDHVLCCPEVTSKKRLLEVVSELLATDLSHISAHEIFDSLINREKLGSTGLGRGVAIPHGRIAALEQPVAAVQLHGEGQALGEIVRHEEDGPRSVSQGLENTANRTTGADDEDILIGKCDAVIDGEICHQANAIGGVAIDRAVFTLDKCIDRAGPLGAGTVCVSEPPCIFLERYGDIQPSAVPGKECPYTRVEMTDPGLDGQRPRVGSRRARYSAGSRYPRERLS